jgi:SagB-type dehydrogenase family enzyme
MTVVGALERACGKTYWATVGILAWAVVVGGLGIALSLGQEKEKQPLRVLETIDLPSPRTKGGLLLDATLAQRRSVRKFTSQPLTMAEIGQLVWAAQGITEPVRGLRTAPSAGATFPLEIYLVEPDGAFHYLPKGHRLERVSNENLRSAIAGSNQDYVRDAALDIVITAVVARTEPKFKDQATRYVYFETGHVAQNVLLQATSLGLGAVCVGGIAEEKVRQALALPSDRQPLYIVSIGHPQVQK